MFFEQFFEFKFDEIDHIGLLDEIHLVEEDEDVSDSDLSAKQDMFFSLRHGSVDSRDNKDTCIHFGCSSDHIFDVVDVSGTVDVSVMASLCLVLQRSSVDSDTSGLLLRCLVDLPVFDVL